MTEEEKIIKTAKRILELQGIVENELCELPSGEKMFINSKHYKYFLEEEIKELKRMAILAKEQYIPGTKPNKIIQMLQNGSITIDQSIKMLNSDKTIEEDLKELGISL